MSTDADGLLDTSTLILLNELADEVQLPEFPVISSITLAELSVGPLVAKTEHERKVRQLHLQLAESEFDSLPFNESAARIYGGIAAELRNSGSKRKCITILFYPCVLYRDSFAKYAVAFFNISRSCVTLASSFFSFIISS